MQWAYAHKSKNGEDTECGKNPKENLQHQQELKHYLATRLIDLCVPPRWDALQRAWRKCLRLVEQPHFRIYNIWDQVLHWNRSNLLIGVWPYGRDCPTEVGGKFFLWARRSSGCFVCFRHIWAEERVICYRAVLPLNTVESPSISQTWLHHRFLHLPPHSRLSQILTLTRRMIISTRRPIRRDARNINIRKNAISREKGPLFDKREDKMGHQRTHFRIDSSTLIEGEISWTFNLAACTSAMFPNTMSSTVWSSFFSAEAANDV
jgi:hypothetical protein